MATRNDGVRSTADNTTEISLLAVGLFVCLSILFFQVGLGAIRGIFTVADVRSWHWPWSLYAASWNALYAILAVFDVRSWTWQVVAGISVVAIFVLLGLKAWLDRNQ